MLLLNLWCSTLLHHAILLYLYFLLFVVIILWPSTWLEFGLCLKTMRKHMFSPIIMATKKTLNFLDMSLPNAWSLDPTSIIAFYYGWVVVTTRRGRKVVQDITRWERIPNHIPSSDVLGLGKWAQDGLKDVVTVDVVLPIIWVSTHSLS